MTLNPKKWPWLTIIAFAGLSFSLGFFYKYNLPQLKSLALLEVEQLSQKYAPFRVWPNSIEFNLFPLGISLTDVRILPKKNLSKQLAPIRIKEIEASLSLVELVQGKFRLSRLYISGAKVNWIEKNSNLLSAMAKSEAKDLSKASKTIKIPFEWDTIYKLPINELSLDSIDLQVQVADPELSAKVSNLSLQVFNRYKAILIQTKSPQFMIKKTKTDPILDLSVEAKVLLEEKGIRISGIKLLRKKSFVVASGILSGDIASFKFHDAKVKARSHFRLAEIRSLVKEFLPKVPFPKVTGTTDIDTEILKIDGINSKANFLVNTRGVSVEGFEIGALSTKGQVENQKFNLSKLSIKNRAGKVSLKDATLEFGNKVQFKAQTKIENLEIARLLQTLTLPKIPLHLLVDGELPCGGEIYPKLGITCKGELTGTRLKVDSGLDDNALNIVELEKFIAKGKVKVDGKAVSYNAKVSLGNSVAGNSKGKISYRKGFNISYGAQKVHFSDIKNLANLKLEGSTSVFGSTKGGSTSASFKMNLNTRSSWLENFQLGQTQFRLSYKKGRLQFNRIKGRINNTRYSGNFRINLRKGRLSLKANIPFLDVDDLEASLGRRWKLPFPISGTGSAAVAVAGPFELKKLDFDLKSQVFRGRIAGESFDVFNIDMFAKNSHIQTRKVSLHRGDSHIQLKGKVLPNGNMDGVAIGRNLRIEQSENISSLDLNLSGVMDLSVKLHGKLQAPKVQVNGRVSQMIVGDQQAADSLFNFKVDSNEMTGSGNFIGELVKTQFQIPVSANRPLKLYFKTNKWDFSHMFNVFANVAFKQDYTTKLTSETYFTSPTGKIKDGVGRLFVEDFLIRRGPLYMTSSGPGYLKVKNGRFTTKNFKLTGKGTYLELSSRSTSEKSPLNLSLKGKVDLSLATLLTPFLEDLRGVASLNIDSSGKILNPDIQGSIYLQDALVKAPAFPHTFTNVNADILFNKKSLLLNSVKGTVAGGTFTAEGRALFKSTKEIPIDIRGNLDKVNLNIPEGFKTSGSGSIFLKGRTFPYYLGGAYEVVSGSVKKDLDQQKSEVKRVQSSRFLPRFLVQENFSPITLWLQVNMPQAIPVNVMVSGSEINTPIKGNILISNTPDDPLLTGKLETEGEGKFIFRSNDFDIRHAKVTFSKSRPSEPILNVAADARIQEYDVNLQVTGKAKEPKILLSSQPILPETEILSLLALGMTSQKAETTTTADSTTEHTSLQIGSAIINQQLGLGKELKKRLGVDFEISSDYDSEEKVSVHRLTFKKQWTPRFGASASRSIGAKPSNKFRLEYKLSEGLSVIGNYEIKELTDQAEGQLDKRGLDLEYKVEFGE